MAHHGTSCNPQARPNRTRDHEQLIEHLRSVAHFAHKLYVAARTRRERDLLILVERRTDHHLRRLLQREEGIA